MEATISLYHKKFESKRKIESEIDEDHKSKLMSLKN